MFYYKEMQETNKNPLVSIIVITYNSERFVLETLESVKNQTYENIELIISDDASTDGTVEVCQKWITKEKKHFLRTLLLTATANSGIPANCNRGVNASKGHWIKFIAGDDALVPECIELNLKHVLKKPTVGVLFSSKAQYKNTFSLADFLQIKPKNSPEIFKEGITAKDQYQTLLTGDQIGFTATLFIKKTILHNVGLFDERYKLIEDYPLWLKLTKAGFKLHFFSDVTVKHRKHAEAVFNTTEKLLIKPSFLRNESLRKEYVYPYISRIYRMDYRYRYFLSGFLSRVFANKSNAITRLIAVALLKYFNPFFWVIRKKP